MNHDPKSLMGMYAANWVWMLGYPDRAAAIAEDCFAHARLIGHPFNYGFALFLGALVFHYRREPDSHYAGLEAAQKLGRETGLPFISEVIVPWYMGVSLAEQRRLPEAIERMQTAQGLWDAAGLSVFTPYMGSQLGEALALSGDVDRALANVNVALEQIARPGWEERAHYAEILRLKGWMLSLKDDFKGAEENYLASLDWARRQQAKSWELRAATSLARLWLDQGKRDAARGVLVRVYEWFTEGFDTLDLKEARVLLDELA